MKKLFNFLVMLAGMYAGIALIFTGYAEWLENLLNFIESPSIDSMVSTIIWLTFAGTSTYLTTKMLGE